MVRLFEVPFSAVLRQAILPNLGTLAGCGWSMCADPVDGMCLVMVYADPAVLQRLAGSEVKDDAVDMICAKYDITYEAMRRNYVGPIVNPDTPPPLYTPRPADPPPAQGIDWIDTITALAAGANPGTTIYLNSGLYTMPNDQVWECSLQGTTDAPITIRNTPGELVRLDARIIQRGANVIWMSDDYGLEIFSSNTRRTSGYAGAADLPCVAGFGIAATNIRLINIRFLDATGTGIYWFGSGYGLIYGCVIANCGYIDPARAHGPGIYTHKHTDTAETKTIENTMVLNSFVYGLQCYSDSTNWIRNYRIRNVVTNSGATFSSNHGQVDDLEIERLWMTGTPLFGIPGQSTEHGNICVSGMITAGEQAFALRNFAQATIMGGKFKSESYAAVERAGGSIYTIEDNQFGNLSGVDVNLVPNIYAPRFATLTVFDWDRQGTVRIDVSAFAESGTLRVHNIILMRQEYRDLPVVNGVLALDMTGWTTPPPLGFDAMWKNAYPGDFGCWILEKLNDAALAA